jgi:ATP synthase protein I
MPQQNPSGLKSLVKAESMVQLALVLPAAVLVGLGLGTLLDHWLHQSWIYLAGIGFGAVAGFTHIIRTAIQLNKEN